MSRGGLTIERLTPEGRRILAQIAALKSKPFVKVGVLQDQFEAPKKERDTAKTVATLGQVAVANEFGTARIPERSFIRSTFEENVAVWRQKTEELRQAVIWGRRTTDWALRYMGEMIKTAFQAKIKSSVPPPNAESTSARKHSSVTLVDTGQLHGSIAYEVHRKGE